VANLKRYFDCASPLMALSPDSREIGILLSSDSAASTVFLRGT